MWCFVLTARKISDTASAMLLRVHLLQPLGASACPAPSSEGADRKQRRMVHQASSRSAARSWMRSLLRCRRAGRHRSLRTSSSHRKQYSRPFGQNDLKPSVACSSTQSWAVWHAENGVVEVKLERGSMLQRMGMSCVSVLLLREFSTLSSPFQKSIMLQTLYACNQAIETCKLILQDIGDAKSSGCM